MIHQRGHMKFALIFLIFFIPHGLTMGDSHFIPGNPVDAKDLPDIDDLRVPEKQNEQRQQREEAPPETKDKKKAPARGKEKQ